MDTLVQKVLEKLAAGDETSDLDKVAEQVTDQILKVAEEEMIDKVAEDIVSEYLQDYQINKLAEEMVDYYLQKHADVEEEASIDEEAAGAKVSKESVKAMLSKFMSGYKGAMKGEGIKEAWKGRKGAKEVAGRMHNPDIKFDKATRAQTKELLKRLGLTGAAYTGTAGAAALPVAGAYAAGKKSK